MMLVTIVPRDHQCMSTRVVSVNSILHVSDVLYAVCYVQQRPLSVWLLVMQHLIN